MEKMRKMYAGLRIGGFVGKQIADGTFGDSAASLEILIRGPT